MDERDDIGTWLEDIANDAKAYADSTRDHYVLLASERIARATVGVFERFVAVITLSMAVLLISIAGSLWIGSLTGNPALGFLCMAGFYVLVWLLFRLFWDRSGRERFIVSIVNAILGHHG